MHQSNQPNKTKLSAQKVQGIKKIHGEVTSDTTEPILELERMLRKIAK